MILLSPVFESFEGEPIETCPQIVGQNGRYELGPRRERVTGGGRARRDEGTRERVFRPPARRKGKSLERSRSGSPEPFLGARLHKNTEPENVPSPVFFLFPTRLPGQRFVYVRPRPCLATLRSASPPLFPSYHEQRPSSSPRPCIPSFLPFSFRCSSLILSSRRELMNPQKRHLFKSVLSLLVAAPPA